MKIIEATLDHLSILVPLFDAYRQFYKQESDLEGAQQFLKNNLTHQQSTVYLAFSDTDIPMGFVQLYPSWESVTMSKRWVLYDLYVAEAGRKKGVGTELMNRAKQLAQDTGSKYLMLETATDNYTAQKLYESLDYQRDNEFYTYILEID